jgi:carbon-monoxide dehydrogenase large subunit
LSAREPRLVGTSVRRLEDKRLISGNGRYVDDIRLASMVHVGIVRSLHAHARILSIDTAEARAMPGVVDVITAADLGDADRPLPLFVPHPALNAAMYGPLARDRVRFMGEAIAAVVAEDRYVLQDALDAVVVDYEPLEAIVDARTALAPGASLIHPEIEGNLAARIEFRIGDAEAVFQAAPHVFREQFSIGRCSGQPMETRGVVALWEPATAHLTVWDSTQTPHLTQRGIVATLGLRREQVRVIAPDVGGGFGPKGILYPEEILVPFLAMRLRRPVKWIEGRREHFMSSFQEREQAHEVEIAFDDEGHILGIRDQYVSDQGAYTPWGVVVPILTTIAMPGPYRVPALHNEIRVAYTNKVPMAPYRGAGRPQGVFVMERLLDIAAVGLGIDPAELRRRNLVPADAFPYDVGLTGRDGTSVVYDSGDYPACLSRLLELLDYRGFRASQADELAAGIYRGIGLAGYVEATGLGPYESAVVRLDEDGSVSVATGSAGHGQGHETVFAQIVGDALGVAMEDVHVTTGDTDRVAYGIGTFASRSTVVAGNAVHAAAGAVAERIRAIASELLEAAPGDLQLRDGRVNVIGSDDRGMELSSVAMAAYGAVPGSTLRASVEPSLEASHAYRPDHPTYANGYHGAIVQVDTGTGEVRVERYVIVHDCGTLINPMLVEGQIVGGLAQGIGNALLEEIVYDENGQLMTSTFMDYLLPTALDMPDSIVTDHLQTPSPGNPLGVKGAGEAGTIPAPAVITNAVEDALRSLGVQLRHTPLSPIRVHAAIREAEAARANASLAPEGPTTAG